jgi:hypothetical protein
MISFTHKKRYKDHSRLTGTIACANVKEKIAHCVRGCIEKGSDLLFALAFHTA